jgi:hypothetical protein
MTLLTASLAQDITPTYVRSQVPHELQQRATQLLARLAST